MKMYYEATNNFNPKDPATYVQYDFRPGVSIIVIVTPEKKLMPYSPKKHNDANQDNGLKAGHVKLEMSYRSYIDKTREERFLQYEIEATRMPTPEEIKFLFSKGIHAYVTVGFDPTKGDDNIKWNTKLGHTKRTDIILLEERIFANAYRPFIPSEHGDADVVSTSVATYQTARSTARKVYKELIKNNKTTSSNFASTATRTTTTSNSSHFNSQVEPAVGFVVPNTLYLTPKENQGIATSDQRKETAEDRPSNAAPSITRNSFNLFKEVTETAVSKDPTQPKRWRPWE